jgi:hypothetical protein
MGAAIKHYINPLHIYCRLRDIGLPKGAAAFLCRLYERVIFKSTPEPGLEGNRVGRHAKPLIPANTFSKGEEGKDSAASLPKGLKAPATGVPETSQVSSTLRNPGSTDVFRPERRSGLDRRCGKDRRSGIERRKCKERGKDRRAGKDRRTGLERRISSQG